MWIRLLQSLWRIARRPSTFTPPNLGISHTITVPAGVKYAVLTTYAVPGGMATNPGVIQEMDASATAYPLFIAANPGAAAASANTFQRPVSYPGYIGVTFFENATAVEAPFRKMNIPDRNSELHLSMSTISAQYCKMYENCTETRPLTVAYRLNDHLEIEAFPPGSVENGNLPPGTASFPRWVTIGNNYHWSCASLLSTVCRIP